MARNFRGLKILWFLLINHEPRKFYPRKFYPSSFFNQSSKSKFIATDQWGMCIIAEPPVSLSLTAPYKCLRHFKVWWRRVSYRRWSEPSVTDNFAIGSSLTCTLQESVTVQDLLLQVYLGEDEDGMTFQWQWQLWSHYWHSGLPGSVQQPPTNWFQALTCSFVQLLIIFSVCPTCILWSSKPNQAGYV